MIKWAYDGRSIVELTNGRDSIYLQVDVEVEEFFENHGISCSYGMSDFGEVKDYMGYFA